jgi:hypothetical protein
MTEGNTSLNAVQGLRHGLSERLLEEGVSI